jgi:hypothetical protein
MSIFSYLSLSIFLTVIVHFIVTFVVVILIVTWDTTLGIPKCRWEDNIKMIFRKWDVGIWTGLGWLRIETSGRH